MSKIEEYHERRNLAIAQAVGAILLTGCGFFASHDYFVPAVMLWIATAISFWNVKETL